MALRFWDGSMIQASQIAAAMSGTARVGAAEDTPQRSGAAPRRPNIVGMEPRQPLDQSGEGAALSAAIQRLIAERDRHKSLAAAQESELIRLKAINDELRRQNEEISLARDRYLGLAAELLTQLQQVEMRRRAETRPSPPSRAASRPSGPLTTESPTKPFSDESVS
jgi:hypothetical protein